MYMREYLVTSVSSEIKCKNAFGEYENWARVQNLNFV